MPCIDPEGKLSENAKKILETLLKKSLSPMEIKDIINKPIYMIRSTMRELTEAKLVLLEGETYSITDEGKKSLNSQ